MDRETKIRTALEGRFSPVKIMIKDQSHLHAGHVGSQDGKGHFDVSIVSDAFAGESQLKRHRMVYDALAQLLQTDIHAVRIKALTPDEIQAE